MYRILILIVLFSSCQSTEENSASEESSNNIVPPETRQEKSVPEQHQQMPQINKEQLTYEAYFSENIGWGYIISIDGKPFINQKHIPSIQGIKGFENEKNAQIAAELVIEKLANNIMPPSLSEKEMDSLNILPAQ